MLNESNLHPYQRAAVGHIINHPEAGLFLEMGLGKTVSTLTAINLLINCYCEVRHVLIVAPLRVAMSTWSDECQQWEHLKGLTISKVLGTVKQREAALKQEADLYIINRENIPWLASKYQHLFANKFFDMLVIDELSSFKSSKTARWRAMRLVRPYFDRVVGLTGTPSPNGYIDLWAELYLLDQGERLGKFITHYRNDYFKGIGNGQVTYKYLAKNGAEDTISRKIEDICISMKSDDYLQLPERIDITKRIELGELQGEYQDFEKKSVLNMFEDSGDKSISAASAAALGIKLAQFCDGNIYDEDRQVHFIHAKKLDALEDIIEAANGQPVLVFYAFKFDIGIIANRFKGYRVRQLQGEQDLIDWNDGKIDIALAHPASAGHGLNLQRGGHITVWYGLTWSLELYQQANARLHRQGQKRPVTIYHLTCPGTIEDDMMKALTKKGDSQNALMDAVKYRINKYLNT
jgi:Superfamily II DNA/RNA helicases, SNF2 family